MSRNGSGTMSIINSFSSNTTIESAKVNANFSDVASEITNSLARNGESGMTGQFKADAGTAAAPGITFSTDLDTGFYRVAANVIGLAQAGSLIGPVTAFPVGTAMLFAQTAAPTGWTKSTTHNDKALRVVSGTASSGGTTAFTTVFGARTIAEANLPSHTHSFSATTGGDTAHTHSFTYSVGAANFGLGGSTSAVRSIQQSGGDTGPISTGAGTSHTHSVSGTTGTGSGSGTAMDFAVQYVDVIIATKD